MTSLILCIIVQFIQNERSHTYHYESYDGDPVISVCCFNDCNFLQDDLVFDVCYINPPEQLRIIQGIALYVFLHTNNLITLENQIFIKRYLLSRHFSNKSNMRDIYVRVCPGILKPENFNDGPASSITYPAKRSIGIRTIRIKIDNDMLDNGWNTIVVFPIMISQNGFIELTDDGDIFYTYYEK